MNHKHSDERLSKAVPGDLPQAEQGTLQADVRQSLIAEIAALQSGAADLQRQLAAAETRATELNTKLSSTRYVLAAALKKIMNVPRNLVGRLRERSKRNSAGASRDEATRLPPRLLQFLDTFRYQDAAPTIEAVNAIVASYVGRVLSSADIAGSLELKNFIAEITARARAYPQAEALDASIIIAVHNNVIDTLCCLKAIVAASSHVSYEIIVADGGSTDATPEIISAIGGRVRYIRNASNFGFTDQCNQAAGSARGDVVVMLNNGAIPLPGWLDELAATLRGDASIGLAGSKLIDGDGSLQSAGGALWSDGSVWKLEPNQDATAPRFSYLKDADFVSGSIALPKPVWEKLGGLDKSFESAIGAYADLAFRVRVAGLRSVYQPLSVIVRAGRDTAHGISLGGEDFRRFHARWKNTLAAEHFPPDTNTVVARDRSRGRSRILFFDHQILQPDRDAGSRIVFEYLLLFKSAGFYVAFWPLSHHFDHPYVTALQRRGVEVLYDAEPMLLSNWLGTYGSDLDYVFLSRATVAAEVLDTIRRQTKAKILFFGQDIQFQRLARELALTNDPVIEREMVQSEAMERDVWRRCDVSYFLSSDECDFVRAQYPHLRVSTIPPVGYGGEEIARVKARLRDVGIVRSGLVLFVGGFRHRPNVDAMLWFMQHVWPHVVARVPSCRLCIAGSAPSAEIRALTGPNVSVTGYISVEALDDLYDSSQVAIVPLRFGAGVKGKVLEALAHGTPVVSTSTGAQGYTSASNFMEICDTAEEFAAAVIDALRDPGSRLEKVLAGLDFLQLNVSKAAARKALAPDVPEMGWPD